MIGPCTQETAYGDIPHVEHKGLRLCVAMRSIRTFRGNELMYHQDGRPIPEKDIQGRLIYALPGGGRIAL